METQFSVVLYDNFLFNKTVVLIVPSNKDLAVLVGLLTDRYKIMQINPIENLLDFESFMEDLKNEKKPKKLEYGKEK